MPQRAVGRFARGAGERRQLVLSERQEHQPAVLDRSSEALREILEPTNDPSPDVEPREVFGEGGGAMGAGREEVGRRHGRHGRQTARTERPNGHRRKHARRLAGSVAAPEDVEHQLEAGVGDGRDAKGAGLDQPQAVAGLALLDQRSVLPQDEREGERLWAMPHLDRHAAPSAVRRRPYPDPPTCRRVARTCVTGVGLAVVTTKATNKQLTTVLGAVPLFGDLSNKQLKKVVDLAEVARFMAGAALVKQGDIGESFYVVLTGQAKVVANARTINRLLPGDHFGEISLLDGGPRTASVVAETEMTLVIITQKGFLAMLAKDPEITICLLEGMARTVRRLDRTLAG